MEGVELTWPGKRRGAPPVCQGTLMIRDRQREEAPGPCNRLIRGHHLSVLGSLLPMMEGEVDLIAVDPPFATGRDFHAVDAIAYSDRLPPGEYLQSFRDGVYFAQRLLKPTGSFYVHLDYRAAPHARFLLDEVFGFDHFQNEIVWSYASGGRTRRAFAAKHDTILVYRRGEAAFFDGESVGIPRGEVRRNHMKRHVDEQGRTYRTIRSAGKEYRYYDDERVPPTDVWSDISHLQQKDPERTGYPTQKPERLLERIILASSPPGGLVLDYHCGSGTTAVVAEKLGRRWIAVDLGELAISITEQRLNALKECQPFRVEEFVAHSSAS